MKIIPVIDLMNSVVVRGVAGQRSSYRPIESVLCSEPTPAVVARAIHQKFGWTEFYVADLDAILHENPNFTIYEELREMGLRLLVDAGLRDAAMADVVLTAGAEKIIVGLETWPSLASLELLVRQIGAERIVFSLDLNQGQSLSSFRDMISSEPLDLAAAVIECGVQEMIVLDLANVGRGAGISTLPLCQQIREFAPECRVITGGGIRDANDLAALESQGLAGVLIASAIHSGAITESL